MHVIIAEKPKVAGKIAAAIGNAKRELFHRKVALYNLNNEYIVIPAVGHVYRLVSKEKGYDYPVFDIGWEESAKVDKKSYYTKDYLAAFKSYAKKADEVTVATDFDNEGSLIGYNIWRFVFKDKPLHRMKFSTLTPSELKKAFENKMEFDYGNAIAGETRHIIDWYYGINLSRALMSSLRKASGQFRVMSIGRVQGPTLALATSREIDIQTFVPKPFWRLFIWLKGSEFEYKEGNIFEKEKAEELYKNIGKEASIKAIKSEEKTLYAPYPYDLTTLQMDAYKAFRFSPSKTLKLAQTLYEASLISYPRTSSQKLPPTVGYKKIIEKISKMKLSEEYREAVDMLLGKAKLWPNQGRKDDPAHPAIYPTGLLPKSNLEGDEKKLYKLVVTRFLASFMDHAKLEQLSITAETNGMEFIAKGQEIKEKGWLTIGKLFYNVEEKKLAKFEEGELVKVDKKQKKEGKTKPPARYTEASLVKELEKRNLGTKATRAMIVATLFMRRYFVKYGHAIRVSELGLAVFRALSEYVPEILSEELTRHVEEELLEIAEKPKGQEKVLKEVKGLLSDVLKTFKENEEKIGQTFLEALNTQKQYVKVKGEKKSKKKA